MSAHDLFPMCVAIHSMIVYHFSQSRWLQYTEEQLLHVQTHVPTMNMYALAYDKLCGSSDVSFPNKSVHARCLIFDVTHPSYMMTCISAGIKLFWWNLCAHYILVRLALRFFSNRNRTTFAICSVHKVVLACIVNGIQ